MDDLVKQPDVLIKRQNEKGQENYDGCIKLWRECFHDSKEYIQYYFSEKVMDNEIYCLEKQNEIVSMLHLNPYEMIIENRVYPTNYIVGVATESGHRKKGYMKTLIYKSLEDLYERKQPFTYLMPAAERIYSPHGFRYIYLQHRVMGKVCLLPQGQRDKQNNTKYKAIESTHSKQWSDLTQKQKKQAVQFVAQQLKSRYQVYPNHTLAYYDRMGNEMQVAGGALVVIWAQDTIIGVLPYMKEDSIVEIVELITTPDKTYACIAEFLKRFKEEKDTESLSINFLETSFLQPEEMEQLLEIEKQVEHPTIMARIVHFEQFIKTMHAKRPIEITLGVTDSIIKENNGNYRIVMDELGAKAERTESTAELILDISEYTSLFFGFRTMADISAEHNEPLGKKIMEDLSSIVVLENCFINDIV